DCVVPRFLRLVGWSLIGLLALFASQASAQSVHAPRSERHPWGSVALGLSIPSVRDPGDELRTQTRLIPAGVLSWLLGAGWGPWVLAARFDVGCGGLRSTNEGVERGVGYVFGIGPSLRASLYEGELGVALVGDASFLHVGTSAERILGNDVTYPQLGQQAVAPGAALQVTGRRKH